MRIFIIIALISAACAEAPYPASGWRPNGQQFSLPSRQPSEQYGAPPQNQNQQYNTLQFSAAQQQQQQQQQQVNNQYGVPAVNQNGGGNQYGAPVDPLRVQFVPREQQARNFNQAQLASNQNGVNNQYGAPAAYQNSVSNQYGAPVDPSRTQFIPREQQGGSFNQARVPSNQNGVNNQYGAPSVDPLRSQSVPKGQPGRNFNQARPESSNPAPGRTYLSQVPENKQFGQLISQDTQNFRNVELFNQQQQQKDDFNESDEDALGDEYGNPTTTKRPRKQPKKPERTTRKPSTTTEQPNTDEDSNVAIATAVAGLPTSGHYHILQQDGKLQRVVYMTSPDPKGDKNAAVIANLMYETVEPIKGPIYQYVGNELVGTTVTFTVVGTT